MLRGVEEVQRRACRGSVDNDEIPGAMGLRFAVQLPQLLHRHVLLGSGELRRQGHIELVLQDRLGLLRRGVRDHDVVEGAFHVEHHRVQAAAGRSVDHGHWPRRVVELADAERLRQPACRVDGQHDDLAAGLRGAYARWRRTWWSCQRRPSRSR